MTGAKNPVTISFSAARKTGVGCMFIQVICMIWKYISMTYVLQLKNREFTFPKIAFYFYIAIEEGFLDEYVLLQSLDTIFIMLQIGCIFINL